jgi:N6-L-threonylcarbamoyladenine synthase
VKVLGVETSCDETAAAVVEDGRAVLSNVISSQVQLHRRYGGVVPELASRNHLQLIDEVIARAMREAGTVFSQLDAVAATYGPGLAISLLIGLNTAQGIALSLGKPFVGINHLEAHLYSPLLSHDPDAVFPCVSLVVSGGHTLLVHCTGVGQHRVLGQTVDDAAGEAFDKVAKLLGLDYPGGPEIDRLARQGNPGAIAFPRSMLEEPSDNFSFSGLKTAVLYHLRKLPQPSTGSHPASLADICASFQEAVVDVLVGKTIRAAQRTGVTAITVSGGVSLNSRLREKFSAAAHHRGWQVIFAPPPLCTDNAAMIAALAWHKLRAGQSGDLCLDVAPSIGLPDAA